MANPGYQGSETSGGEITVYPQKGDPFIVQGESEFKMDRGRSLDERWGNLVSVQTSKAMGAASGSWVATLKQSRVTRALLEMVADDDWVDIVFTRHGRKYHAMRGLVDEIRRSRTVGGSGATVETYTLSGRDFGSIWERTPIFFSQWLDPTVTGGVGMRVFQGTFKIYKSPDVAVEGFLRGFLEELGEGGDSVGRANWIIPEGVPNVGGEPFIDAVRFDTEGFTNEPERNAPSANYLMPQGQLWDLAQEWSDPQFCELFCDTQTTANFLRKFGAAERPITQASMQVTYRDRPFPLVSVAGQPLGKDSPYFSLRETEIPREVIESEDIGRSGLERYNAFFITPQFHQESMKSQKDMVLPLWDEQDIEKHGLRRFDVQSNYVAAKANLLQMNRTQRLRLRDWHAINPYMLNGTLGLGRGYPWIHIGERVRIPGESADLDTSFYVESAVNNWTFGSPIKTQLGVTRGWIGTDDSHVDALVKMADRYRVATPRREA